MNVDVPRDQIVDASWWEGDFRELLDENIAYSADLLPKRLTNERAIEDANLWATSRLTKWQFDYSAGRPLDELAAEFEDILVSWMSFIDSSRLELSLPDISALAQLFGLEETCAEFWPGGRIDFGWARRTLTAQWLLGDPHALTDSSYVAEPKDKKGTLRALIESAEANSVTASGDLEAYVRQHWYRSNRGAPWWGSHNRNGEPVGYIGYWCFQAAAVARICGVDDSALKEHKYYPYDLAHYLD